MVIIILYPLSVILIRTIFRTEFDGQDQMKVPNIVPVRHLLARWFIEEKIN